MRRIAIVSEGMGGVMPIPNVNGGAVETWITDLIRQNETGKGCYFDVFSCYSKEAKKYKFKHTKVHYFRTFWIEKFICKVANFLIRRICKRASFITPYNWKVAHFTDWGKYDYILVENGMSIYEEIVKRPFTAGKMVYHMRNDLEYVSKVPWAERSDVRTRLVGRTAKEVLAVSGYIRDRFLSVQPTEHIRVFYNCVDEQRYSIGNVKKTDALRRKYKITEKDVIFLFTGRVREVKGVLEAAKAFARIADRCKDAKFLIAGEVGPSSYGNAIHKVLDHLGGGKRVIYVGTVPDYDMQEIYALGDVVVAPTIDEEPFGMITLEAMSMEKALIVSDSGGFPEIVDDGCAIVAYRGKGFIKELAGAMEYLYQNPEIRIRMGKKGREKVLATYDFRKEFLLSRMMGLWEELDNRRNG